MFTGIIEEIGTIKSVKWSPVSATLVVGASLVLENLKVGDSINTNGACLTVTGFGIDFFITDVMAETMRKTNLNELKPGSEVNLERAMQAGARFGGHMVSGHIDNTGQISNFSKEGIATWITVEASEDVLRYIIYKGSVAIDGISLTVATLNEKGFQVSIIPHTSKQTTLLNKKEGDRVNIECDMMAKYIEKFINQTQQKRSKIDRDFLSEHGYID